eukprot:scaffold72776_cov69-Phaeocystis_antarctica.AAC.7
MGRSLATGVPRRSAAQAPRQAARRRSWATRAASRRRAGGGPASGRGAPEPPCRCERSHPRLESQRS